MIVFMDTDGGAGGGGSIIWSPVDADNTGSPDVFVQSNGGRTVSSIGDNSNAQTRSDTGKASGKWYWEASFSTASHTSDCYLGVIDNAQSDLTFANTYLWVINGTVYQANGTAAGTPGAYAVGDVVMFALDMDNLRLYVGKNGTWRNSGDPAAGTGYVWSAFPAATYRAQIKRNNNNTSSFVCTLASTLTYSPPTGFTAW